VQVADELLRVVFFASFTDSPTPNIEMRRPTEGHGSTGHAPDRYGCKSPLGAICFHDAIVEFKGDNHSVTYRVDEYIPETNTWTMSWPD
jgi:hypothetical protein